MATRKRIRTNRSMARLLMQERERSLVKIVVMTPESIVTLKLCITMTSDLMQKDTGPAIMMMFTISIMVRGITAWAMLGFQRMRMEIFGFYRLVIETDRLELQR